MKIRIRKREVVFYETVIEVPEGGDPVETLIAQEDSDSPPEWDMDEINGESEIVGWQPE